MSETSLKDVMVDDFILVHELDTTEKLDTSPRRYVVILAPADDDAEDAPVKMATAQQIKEKAARGTVSKAVLEELLPLAQSTVGETFHDMRTDFMTVHLTDSMEEVYPTLNVPDRYVIILDSEGLPGRLTTAREMKRKMPRSAKWPLVSEMAARLPQASWIEKDAPDLAAALLKDEMEQNRTEALIVMRGTGTKEIVGLVPSESLERLRRPRYRQYMPRLPEALLAPETLTMQRALAYLPMFMQSEFQDSPGIVVMRGHKVAGILPYDDLAAEYQKHFDERFEIQQALGVKMQVTRSALTAALANVEASARYRCRRYPRCPGERTVPLVDGPPLCNITSLHGHMVPLE